MIDKRHTIGYIFEYSEEKNRKLLEERGIGFSDLLESIERGGLIRIISHPNCEKYPHQVMLEVKMGDYVYAIPSVIKGKQCFMKTAYPSRKATRNYRNK